ncbi:ABC transporter permease [Cohnella yongneupensis]|uniref:ABC transporter permease n=1 Tax=Cohnella yongneupensis TaxID=425006 RepID=A0ABW0R7S5_9BACL
MNGTRATLKGRLLPASIWTILLIAAWETVSWVLLDVRHVPLAQSKLPYLHKVAETFGQYGHTLLHEGRVTLGNAALGFAIGAAAGVLIAVLMSGSKLLEHLIFPYAVASQMIPILGLAPIIYGIVHDEQSARIIISGYITFFPVAINMLRGLRSVSPDALDLMRACAANPLQVYGKLRLPASLPGLFAGLKIAAPLAVTGAILVELMGAQRGIGVLMLRNLYYGPSHVYMFWSTVFVGAALGMIGFVVMSAAERLIAPWQPEYRAKGGKS